MAQKTVNEYITHINQYPEAKYPHIGKIYVFAYLFNQTINQKKSYNELKDEGEIKFYDFLPATFIWRVFPRDNRFSGFNLHTIPLLARRRWIEVLQTYAGEENPDPKKFLYLKRLFEITPFAMRQYEMRKVRKLKEIPITQWSDLLNFEVNTTFRATSTEIIAKYLSLIK